MLHIIMEIYYEEMTHVTMEAEKSNSLPSASWRHRYNPN